MSTQDINDNQSTVFRRYDDGYLVRAMTPEDAKIVQKWYTGMGIISVHDVDIALASYPPGCKGFYIGELDGKVISSALRIPWSDNVYYGSMYYVDKDYRRKGYGTRLRDEVAFEHVGKNILCVDAVEGKVAETNHKFGYKEAGWLTVRYEGVAKKNVEGLLPLNNEKIEHISNVSFEDLISYDNKVFVSANIPQRKAFLEKWTVIPGGATYVAKDSSGNIVGYGCRRPAVQNGNHLIGPVYAQNAAAAEHILQKLCEGVAGDKVTINTWDLNENASSMVKKFGLDHVFNVVRQHVNGHANEYKHTTYAVTSIDVCGF